MNIIIKLKIKKKQKISLNTFIYFNTRTMYCHYLCLKIQMHFLIDLINFKKYKYYSILYTCYPEKELDHERAVTNEMLENLEQVSANKKAHVLIEEAVEEDAVKLAVIEKV
jgi:hypothetical protein